MENFVVSARKYRPGTFDSVVGQQHITTTLKNAISSHHLAQAFLFCGPRGVGKTTCARILAKTINCENLTPETEACNECDSCRSFNSNSSFNIHELDAASNNSVEDIRNLVEQVRYAPQTGKYKIYIIDEVHMLSNSAFNAFLKTLEEPPSYAIFILATTERHKIIPTILSRCQIFDFNRIRIDDMVKHLQNIAGKEQIDAEPDGLHLIAQKADGALRDALSIFDQMVTFSGNHVTYKDVVNNLHILDYDYYFQLTDDLLNGNLPGALLLFDDILKNGFDAHNFVIGIGEHFRGLLVCKDNATVQLLEVSETVKARYAEQANAASVSFLLSGLNIIGTCDQQFKSSKNQRLHVELALMKLAHLNNAIQFARDFAESGEVKKKTSLSSGASTPETQASAPAPSAPVTPPAAPVSAKLQEPLEVPGTVPSAAMQSHGQPVADVPSGSLQSAAPLKEVPSATLQAPVHHEEVEHGVLPIPPPKKLSKLPSLKDLAKKVENAGQPDNTVNEANKPEEVYSGAIVPVNKEKLQQYWDDFARRKRQENLSEFMILNRPFEVNEKNEILLNVENPVQVDQFNAFKPELLGELRAKLNNRSISVKIEMKTELEGLRLYTSIDKFNYLSKLYPTLSELKTRLGLDTDF